MLVENGTGIGCLFIWYLMVSHGTSYLQCLTTHKHWDILLNMLGYANYACIKYPPGSALAPAMPCHHVFQDFGQFVLWVIWRKHVFPMPPVAPAG